VNVALTVLITASASLLAIASILLVRRKAPDGGYFHDGDRASGVFGVLATGFSVLLGFVVFLAFESYDNSRAGAETEALVIAQQFQTAQHMPLDVRDQLGGELVCYARSVVDQEWPRMESGTEGNAINPWAVAMFQTLRPVEPDVPSEEAAYGKWLDQTSDREAGRMQRIHAAEGVIPGPLWMVLIVVALLIFVYMLFFADSGERAVVQGLMMGTVVTVMVLLLLIIGFLNNPFRPGFGSLQPTSMERTLEILEQERSITNDEGPLPCGENGESLSDD
jgi:4-amino-4-deoxy-L-arabinose transferase-like glycosyltransferase